jgi:hypothetical protein
MDHREAIKELLRTRFVQTNHIRRCTSLLPALNLVTSIVPDLPLSYVEMGTSAGLNLLWDEYSYHYTGKRCNGYINSPIQLHCTLRGDYDPPIYNTLPKMIYHVGIDNNPLDVNNDDDVNWLKSLIWPEHYEQSIILEKAIEIAKQRYLYIKKGDILDILPDVIDNVPNNTALVLFNSYTLYQFTEEEKHDLHSLIASVGTKRDVFWISIEWHDLETPSVKLTSFTAGGCEERVLARCDGQGRWLEWLLPS